MGLLDEVLGGATPDGNLAKPLMIAAGALLVGRMLSGGGSHAEPSAGQAGDAPEGGGLGGLLDKLKQAGHGDTVKSWLGSGQNAPIDPKQLGSALGQKTVSSLAQQSGISEQDLLAQLSKVLPGLVDKLTPDGQVPNPQDLASRLGQ